MMVYLGRPNCEHLDNFRRCRVHRGDFLTRWLSPPGHGEGRPHCVLDPYYAGERQDGVATCPDQKPRPRPAPPMASTSGVRSPTAMLFGLPTPTIREKLNPAYDCSIWQAARRAVRGPFRRAFFPNGPAWFKDRIPSLNLIKALNKCTDREAEARQQRLDDSRLATWLKGF